MTFETYMQNLNPEIKEYFKIISPIFPRFLIPYIETPTMERLSGISYFCGMEQGPKEVYNFKYFLSRLDHSISVALMTWSITFNKKATLQALFHDANTPAFSHVIDYMNGDAVTQETTEIGLLDYLKHDKQLVDLSNKFGPSLEVISDFKSNSIIDTKRPRLCADRLDSCFLSNLVWLQTTNLEEIKKLYNDTMIHTNEDEKLEIGFLDLASADRVVELQENINAATHKEEEFEAMSLLGQIVKRLIDTHIITYNILFYLTDNQLMMIIKQRINKDEYLSTLYEQFMSLKPTGRNTTKPVKDQIIDPLVLNYRYRTY
ncbi:MAG: hypothetical protein IKQ29_03485 [Bacilli bacterium]|nr:hypothetical protein [Bacilli bacterium]